MSDEGRTDASRWKAGLRRALDRLEVPLAILGLAWLGLLVLEFTTGLTPATQGAFFAIWAIFIIDFLLELLVAPARLTYLKRNWLTALSLVIPVLRVFRAIAAVRALAALRGVRLVRVVTTMRRGMRAVGHSFGRRGATYVIAATVVVLFAGAAGMYAFERLPGGQGLTSFGDALWWTAMLLTTIGSQYWPVTIEGRILAFLLALYAVGVFGYVAGSLAAFFVGQEEGGDEDGGGRPASDRAVSELRDEVAALRAQLRGGETRDDA